MTGRIHSVQSLGTVDGPGIRFVVFMQGCNLRCDCCHNPDTWDTDGGTEADPEEIIVKAERYKAYFGSEGGITISGGEPLLQPEFCKEVFRGCHEKGINTCLDTSGCILNDGIKQMLCETDRVLLDIKYTDDRLYREHAGCSLQKPLEFLSYLNDKQTAVTLRQVIIPTLNDSEDSVYYLKELANKYSCVDNIELLPFRNICQVKYDKMGIPFPFAAIPLPAKEKMQMLERIIKD